MPHHLRFVYPFTAIVGQEKMKKALLLNAINPKIGGVLIRGQKGTGKTTAVRALADILPEIKVVKNCYFNCDPDNPLEMCDLCYEKFKRGEKLEWIKRKVKIVNLPLNATVDRVVGTLDIERALKEGIKALDPGLLAEANRGILYIDEVNLLDDYIVDILLDVAASGVNIVERENISVSHPSRFILIGTMNPEEGELRPQLLDRFGLQVEVEPITDPALQIEIIKRVEEFEASPMEFIAKYEEKQKELRFRIEKAQELLPKVQISEELLHEIAEICSKLAVSNRAPIVITKTAKTIAAFSGRANVTREDVLEAMELALPHRIRKKPFERPHLPREKIEELLSKRSSHNIGSSAPCSNPFYLLGGKGDGRQGENVRELQSDKVFEVGQPLSTDLKVTYPRKIPAERTGKTVSAKSIGCSRGAYIYSTVPRDKCKLYDIALDATIRAAAARCAARGETILRISDEDIREKVRRVKTSSLIVFIVDASGSMAAQKRMEVAKGAVIGLLADAYKRRDKVAFIAFRGEVSEILLPPTSNIDYAKEALVKLPTGGKTPLSHALLNALNIIKLEKRKRPFSVKPLIVLITDGKANVSLGGEIRQEIVNICEKIRETNAHFIVIDVQDDPFAPNCIKDIVEATGAKHIKVKELTDVTLQRMITDCYPNISGSFNI